LKVISAEGESIGFKLNVNKSVILLGRTETDAEALAKKSEYMTLGFSESCILIHPDNLPGSSASYGTKLLGCFIGHEDFIRSRIQAKAEKLKKIAGNMQKVDSKQIQFLLLGQCFNAKVNYLSRTTSPDRMLPLLNEFESMKKTILENIVEETIDEKRFKLSQLPISESGLGLRDSVLDSHGAFVAAHAEFYSENQSLYDEAQDHHLLCLQQISTSIDVLQRFNPQLTFQSVINKIRDANGAAAYKTQHELCKMWKEAHRQNIMDQFEGREKVIINSFWDEDCGRWLTMPPKSHLFAFTNPEYLSAIRFRLAMFQEGIINGTACKCTRDRKFQIDGYGLHFGTGCKLRGVRINVHDEMVRTIQSICSYASLSSKREPRDMFLGNNFNLPDGSKGDLAITGFGIKTKLLDVRVTSACPANGGVLNVRDTNDKDFTKKNLKRNYNEKMRHYGPACEAANVEFIPCVVDIGGQMHESYKDLVKKILKRASDQRQIPLSVLWNYWLCALLVSLYRGRAKNMIGLTNQVFVVRSPETYESSDIVVSRSSYINRK
jgi:hypothetical protein